MPLRAAEALYVGLVTDTGRFQYTNTSPASLRLAADLVGAGRAPAGDLLGDLGDGPAGQAAAARPSARARPLAGRRQAARDVAGARRLRGLRRRGSVLGGRHRPPARGRGRGGRGADPRAARPRRAALEGLAARARGRRRRLGDRAPARRRRPHRRGRLLDRREPRRDRGLPARPGARPRSRRPRERGPARRQARRPDLLRGRRGRAPGARRGAKVGHAGTLDPFATGLLVCWPVRSTRLAPYLVGLDKRYRHHAQARRALGHRRPRRRGAADRRRAAVAARAAGRLRRRSSGRGRRCRRRRPRSGSTGARPTSACGPARPWCMPPRDVVLYDLDILSHDVAAGVATLALRCSKGFYVRALARDLGEALGCGAYCDELRRTAVGHLDVDRAGSPEAVAAAPLEAPWHRTPADALAHLPAPRARRGRARRARARPRRSPLAASRARRAASATACWSPGRAARRRAAPPRRPRARGMRVVEGIAALARGLRPRVVALGSFDGVHLGHRALVEDDRSKPRAATASLLDRAHVRPAADGGAAPRCRAATAFRGRPARGAGRRARPRRAAGCALRRGARIARPRALRRRGAARGDRRRARGRAGSTTASGIAPRATSIACARSGDRFGFEVTAAAAAAGRGRACLVVVDPRAVQQGRGKRAARLLGRDPWLDGVVIRGDGRGRGLGIPTANLRPRPGSVVPAIGVYAGYAHVPGPGAAPARRSRSGATRPSATTAPSASRPT